MIDTTDMSSDEIKEAMLREHKNTCIDYLRSSFSLVQADISIINTLNDQNIFDKIQILDKSVLYRHVDSINYYIKRLYVDISKLKCAIRLLPDNNES